MGLLLPLRALSLIFLILFFFIYLKIYDIVPHDRRPGCSMTVADVARGTMSNRCMIQWFCEPPYVFLVLENGHEWILVLVLV
jgi:hypothetical protein